MNSKYDVNLVECPNKFKAEFAEIGKLGHGSYGRVIKVKSIKNEHFYAIKIIPYKTEETDKLLKEVYFLSNLNSTYAVKCYEFWAENNYYHSLQQSGEESSESGKTMMYDPYKSHLMHIKLEYCPLTLYDVIKLKNTVTRLNYFIKSVLFFEAIECVNYLHTLPQPIIHRDLKPKNLLLSNGSNGRFIKLCDFGLSTIHEFENQSHTGHCGSNKYMAPEVVQCSNYNTSADIYSLGVIMQILFNLNKGICHIMFPEKHQLMENQLLGMTAYRALDRPTCARLMMDKRWLLNDEEINAVIKEQDALNITSTPALILSQVDVFYQKFLTINHTQKETTDK